VIFSLPYGAWWTEIGSYRLKLRASTLRMISFSRLLNPFHFQLARHFSRA